MKRIFRLLALRIFTIPLLKLAIFPSYFLFRVNFKQLKKIQLRKLKSLISGLKKTEFVKSSSVKRSSLSFFTENFKPSQYNDWMPYIEREKSGERVFAEEPFFISPQVKLQ